MKSLVEYINENLHINEALILFKPSAKTAQDAAKIEDAIKSFINNSNKRYSFDNKTDLQQMFKDFCSKSKISTKLLKEFGVIDGKTIASLIIANKEKLEKDGWKFDCIKSFDETEQQIVDLVLLMTRKVVKVISENQRTVVMNNIVQALRKVKGRGDVTIRVNLADVELTTEHTNDFIQAVENIKNI